MHNVPSKLKIDGQSFYLAFYRDTEFNSDNMNAIMRLYHQLDDEMYRACHEKRWRHCCPVVKFIFNSEQVALFAWLISQVLLTDLLGEKNNVRWLQKYGL